MKLIVKNETKNIIIAEKGKIAKNFFTRLKGLLGKKYLEKDECLILTKCGLIHTIFMRFPIDVLFLDRDFKVLKIIKNLLPYKLSPLVKGSEYVIELCSGKLNEINTEVGDIIKWKKN